MKLNLILNWVFDGVFFVVIEKMRIISEDDNGIMLGCWNARTSRNVLDFLIFQVLSLIIGSTLPDSENI